MTKYWLNNFAIDDFIISALKEAQISGNVTTKEEAVDFVISNFGIKS